MRFRALKHETGAEYSDRVYTEELARPWVLEIDGELARTKSGVGKRFKTEEAALEAGREHFSRDVLRASCSPMNKLRWSCDLKCGHEVWVTSQRKPKRTFCETCAAA